MRLARRPPPAVAEFIHRGTEYHATAQLRMGVYEVVFDCEGKQVARYVYRSIGTLQEALVKALEAWYADAGPEMETEYQN